MFDVSLYLRFMRKPAHYLIAGVPRSSSKVEILDMCGIPAHGFEKTFITTRPGE
jgi:hypothetical protein